MQILLLEMKRVVKSRMTWIPLLVAAALSVMISFSVISDAQYLSVDQDGKAVKITGMDAIRASKEQARPYEGTVTEAKLRDALAVFQNVSRKYGEKIPTAEFYNKLVPPSYFLNMIGTVYAGGGEEQDALGKVNPDDVGGFYQRRSEVLKNDLETKYPGSQDVVRQARKLNDKVRTPFVFQDGYTSDNAANLCVLIFLLVLIGATVVSGTFAADYQNSSDDILRCTKNGHVKFAVAKLCSSVLIVLAMFAVCILIFVLSVDSAYGWDSLRTSVQVLFPLSFLPFTVGQAQGATVLAGLLTLLAAVCFALFASAKCRHPTTALTIVLAFCILPAILHSVADGNIADFLTCVLPTGGAGISHNFFNQLNQSAFVQIGPFRVWAPYLTIGAAILEIPLFFVLSIRAYCRHQAA